MSQFSAPGRSRTLFPRTRESLANAAIRLDSRRRVERELSSLGDRALADIGLYRSDIMEFAYTASARPASEPLLRAFIGDLASLLHHRKGERLSAPAAE